LNQKLLPLGIPLDSIPPNLTLGFEKKDIETAAGIATQNPYYNPRPVTREGIVGILNDAFEGRRPLSPQREHPAQIK
jgi:hypothetical protein